MHRVRPTRTGTVTHASASATQKRYMYAIPNRYGIVRDVAVTAWPFSYAVPIWSGTAIPVHASVAPLRVVALTNGGTVRLVAASVSLLENVAIIRFGTVRRVLVNVGVPPTGALWEVSYHWILASASGSLKASDCQGRTIL